MRLICPNCDAQYEVDDNAIPPEGRDVQCSNCGHAWFEERAPEPEDAAADLYREPDPADEPPVPEAVDQSEPEEDTQDDAPPLDAPPPKRSLDDSVLAVLREEAEIEAAARRAEASGIEMQGDLGLPPPVSPSVGAVAADPSVMPVAASAISDTEKRIAAMKGEPDTPPKPMARRDLLPDIEEINSSLSPSDSASSAPEDDLPDLTKAGKRSGFRSGFVLMVFVAVVGAVAYLMAPQIAQQIPGAADAMASYVAAVDALRLWLDGLVRLATSLLNGLTGNTSNPG